MSGLAEAVQLWAREIIIILLLAGALEMILPETDVKRFARVALGFFVVLAVGRPVLGAIGGGFLFDRDLAALGSWELGSAPAGWANGGWPGTAGSSNGAGSQQGSELYQSSRDRALVAARAALETQIAALAKREPEVGDAAAEVDLVSDPSSASYGNLEAVRLRVWLASEAGAPGETGSSEAGEGVEPVVIEVVPVISVGGFPGSGAGASQPGPGQATPGSAAGSGSSAPLASVSGEEAATGSSEAARELATRLKSQLVLLFGVPPGGITVEVWP